MKVLKNIVQIEYVHVQLGTFKNLYMNDKL